MKPKSYMYWMKNDILCRYLRTGWWGRLSCLQIQMFCRIVSNWKSSYENERVSCCVLSNSNNYNIYYNTGMKFVDANRKLSSIWLSELYCSLTTYTAPIYSVIPIPPSLTHFFYPALLSNLNHNMPDGGYFPLSLITTAISAVDYVPVENWFSETMKYL